MGVGGGGSWAAEALARSGVGKITLVDLDHVAESNINRQIQATEASLGQAKVVAMSDRIHAYFPECVVTCLEEFVTPDNWQHQLPGGVDAVSYTHLDVYKGQVQGGVPRLAALEAQVRGE